MSKYEYIIPAKPRSKVFTYYSDAQVSTGSSTSIVPPAVDTTESEININNLNNNSIVTNIAINPADPNTIDVTKANLTVTPTGSGDVVTGISVTSPTTINVQKGNSGISLNTSGTGNTVVDMGYNTATRALTAYFGTRLAQMPLYYMGNLVSSAVKIFTGFYTLSNVTIAANSSYLVRKISYSSIGATLLYTGFTSYNGENVTSASYYGLIASHYADGSYINLYLINTSPTDKTVFVDVDYLFFGY